MRIGAFKRLASYLLDAIPLLFILGLLFSLLVSNMLQPDNYDRVMTIYEENQTEYFNTLEGYYDDFDEGLITETELQEKEQNLLEDFLNNNEYLENVIYTYYTNTALYYYFGFTLLYFIYILITKGQTFGRRFLKIQLSGRVTFWTLFLREILWKNIFWTFTFGIGFIIDWIMITFTRKKRTLRDTLTETYLSHAGIDYPF
ncbi:MAG: RDD family protein [Candidatus Izemoplasmataceae bacterium]